MRVGREGRHACAGQLDGDAQAVGPRFQRRQLRPVFAELHQALRHDPGDRPDRFG